jgi:hypothetical protein
MINDGNYIHAVIILSEFMYDVERNGKILRKDTPGISYIELIKAYKASKWSRYYMTMTKELFDIKMKHHASMDNKT